MIIPVILGPTCIGKTSLALEIAKESNTDILSIDSRQVFKNLDIVTGKFKDEVVVNKNEGYWEIEGTRIWGYDLFLPNENLNVLKFCEFAKKIILEYQKKQKKLIVTCGTGFYLDFLSGNISYNEIDENRKIFLHSKTNQELRDLLSTYEQDSQIDLNNNLRIITRILNYESSSEKRNFQIEGATFRIFYLSDLRSSLYKNADNFTEDILKKGAIEEYQNNYNLYGECRSLDGLIYKEIGDYLAGRILFEKMKLQIKFSLHSYIRRQLTYFKRMKVDYSSDNRKDIAEKIKVLL